MTRTVRRTATGDDAEAVEAMAGLVPVDVGPAVAATRVVPVPADEVAVAEARAVVGG